MKRRNRTGRPEARRAGRLLAAALVALLAAAGAGHAQDKAEFDYAAVPLRVGVWVDKAAGEVYAKGDAQTVTFQANEDAYAVVYRIDTEGEVTVLWPRGRMDDGFVFGGHEYVLPVQGARPLRVAATEGEGFVEAIVSRYPFDLRALELDFHHENPSTRYAFRVAGDPFLAMNEVNFAITGLENAEDFVVTNYASYYVHREVDHPRYLCNQCHFDEGSSYDPYRDTCSLNITVDYRWGNSWWATYGYYPVYYYPSYVYVDPWTWRPWVNFWYDPWWYCPTVSVCAWPTPCYPWYDSPYYGGNCGSGTPRYKPLNPGGGGDGARTKVREYGALSPMLAAGGKTTARDGALGDARTAYRGEPRKVRQAPAIDDNVRTRGKAGLRIREGGSVRGGPDGEQARVRHTAGGSRTPSALVPVSDEVRGGGGQRVRSPATAAGAQRQVDSGQRAGARGGADSRAITPVAPRQKGTRIWNTGRSGGDDSGARRPEQVRPGGRTGGSDSSRDGAVRPRSGSSAGRGAEGSGGNRGGSGDTRTRSGSDSGGGNNKATRGGGSGGGSKVGGGSSRGGGSAAGSSGGRSSSSGGGQSRGGSSSGGSSRRGG